MWHECKNPGRNGQMPKWFRIKTTKKFIAANILLLNSTLISKKGKMIWFGYEWNCGTCRTVNNYNTDCISIEWI